LAALSSHLVFIQDYEPDLVAISEKYPLPTRDVMHRDIQVVVETIKGDPNAKLPLDWPRNEDPYATSDEANNQTALAGATRRNNNNNNKDSKPGAVQNSQIDLPVAPSLSVADLLSVATPPPAVSNQHALSLMSLSEHARSLQHTSGQTNFTGNHLLPAKASRLSWLELSKQFCLTTASACTRL
jgi:hypothetical protein